MVSWEERKHVLSASEPVTLISLSLTFYKMGPWSLASSGVERFHELEQTECLVPGVASNSFP